MVYASAAIAERSLKFRDAGQQRHARAMDVSPELLEERWIPSDAFV
jgi:hypothetical protein